MRLPKWGHWVVLTFVGVALLLAGGCGSGNSAPEISSVTPSPGSVGLGGSTTIVCVANDADGDSLTYSWTATDGAITWEASMASWVAPGIEGTYTITVTVDDGQGGTDTSTCYVTVGVATGAINITSIPVGAGVYLDGQDSGKVTPCSVENLAEGGYTVTLTYYHHKAEVGTVMVETGVVSYIDWVLDYADEKTQTVQPSFTSGNDAYVYQDSPAGVFATEDYLYVGGEIAKRFYRSYLEFELSVIPSTAVVTEAEVGVFFDATSGAVPAVVGAHKVISSWDEDDIDWAHQPDWTATPESTVSVPAVQTQDFVYWDITDLVQGWVDGSVANRGVLLKDADENTVKAWKRFYSANEEIHTDWHPKLVITYFDPSP